MPSSSRARAAFRTLAVVEAFTWAGLLAGMAVKYLGSGAETGVHVFGPLHGAAFVAYCLATLLVARTFGWGPVRTLVGLAASVPPFGTWVFEAWALRHGHLDVAEREPVPA
jgi:integral membrane protein